MGEYGHSPVVIANETKRISQARKTNNSTVNHMVPSFGLLQAWERVGVRRGLRSVIGACFIVFLHAVLHTENFRRSASNIPMPHLTAAVTDCRCEDPFVFNWNFGRTSFGIPLKLVARVSRLIRKQPYTITRRGDGFISRSCDITARFPLCRYVHCHSRNGRCISINGCILPK